MGNPRKLTPRPAPPRGFALLLLVLLATGCTDPAPVKIGFVGGLTGRVADLGISGRNGVTLAIEETNRAGGIGGRTVELVVRDDRQDGDVALRVDRELLDLGVEAVIGHMTSSMTLKGLPLFEDRGVCLVSPTTTTDYLTGKKDHFFRVSGTTRRYARKMARYLREDRHLGRVSMVYDDRNRAYTESWIKQFREEFEGSGGRVDRVTTFHSGPDAHLLEVARTALAGAPEGVVVVASAMDAAMVAQQVRKTGSRTLLAGAEWASTEKLVELGGPAVEGFVLSQFFDRESSDPGYQAFRAAYVDRFGAEPGFAAVNAYDAAKVVFQALEGRRPGETLADAIPRIGTFKGIQGLVTLDEYGDGYRSAALAEVRDGRFVVVE